MTGRAHSNLCNFTPASGARALRRVGQWVSLWIALSPALAIAQFEETSNGIKVGEGRLHPYIGLEMRYDSAAGYFGANNTLGAELVDHVAPGMRYDLLSSQWAMNFDGRADYVRYLGAISPGSEKISRLQANGDLNLIYGREQKVGFELVDHFFRSNQTPNAAVGVGVLSLGNNVQAKIPIRPGGGALELIPGASFSFENFEALSSLPVPGCADPSCDPNFVPSMNYKNLRPMLEARWKFFPKTALVVETGMDFRSYNNTANPASKLARALIGVSGLVSTRVVAVAKAGWAKDFDGTRNSTPIANLEVSYLLSDINTLKLGGLRTLEPVPVYGSYVDNRVYSEVRLLMGGRLIVHGQAALDYVQFSSSPRNDTTVSFDVGLDYQLMRWITLAAGYTLTYRTSSSAALTFNYSRHEPYFRVTCIY
jgi:hypothetical protein